MKSKELRDKTDDVLKEELTKQQKQLFALRSQAVTEKLEDSSQLGKAKREIARIKTILRERQLAAAAGK